MGSVKHSGELSVVLLIYIYIYKRNRRGEPDPDLQEKPTKKVAEDECRGLTGKPFLRTCRGNS